MKAPGHTIVLCVQSGFPQVRITLECTCGEVLHFGMFAVDDPVNRQHIRDEGHDLAKAHLAETLVAHQS